MEKKNRNRHVEALLAIMIFGVILHLGTSVVLADWGMIPILPVSVFEPGQKAIIAWNGQKEILILSADVASTANTTVLQIMPLPSIPTKIEEARMESFYAVEELIWYHVSIIPFGEAEWYVPRDVTVVFHEKIGMHDITVVEAYNVSDFAKWMDEFLLKNGITEQVALQDFTSIIEAYMSRDFHFYVLDLIDTSSEQKSVEPILYEFNTSFLYYPLLITTPVGGDGKITLFLITRHVVGYGYHPLMKAQYYSEEDFESIEFEVSKEELSLIDSRIGELFEDKAWLTTLIYDGPLGTLTEDLTIKPLVGDLDFDGIVNINDVAVAGFAFGSYPGHSRWNPMADLNDDGVINILDLATIITDFGKTY